MRLLFAVLAILSIKYSFSQESYILDSIAEPNGFTYLARPIDTGPFPAVLYSHGGLGGVIGGDLRETCISLAQSGYISWCELRSDTLPIPPHIEQVELSLDSLLNQSDVDLDNIGIIGFSRGGLLTLVTAVNRYSDVNAVVTMAPAAAGNYLYNTLNQAYTIDDPVLVLVAENDLYQDDHVQLADDVAQALDTYTDVIHIEYDAYDSDNNGVINNLDDGHELFWEVQQPYWSDLIEFLDNNLKDDISFLEQIQVNQNENRLFKITDMLGREVNHKTNTTLLYLYDNGIVEKKFVLE